MRILLASEVEQLLPCLEMQCGVGVATENYRRPPTIFKSSDRPATGSGIKLGLSFSLNNSFHFLFHYPNIPPICPLL